MIQNEREIRHEHVLEAVRQMMTAARTAPKGKGFCTLYWIYRSRGKDAYREI